MNEDLEFVPNPQIFEKPSTILVEGSGSLERLSLSQKSPYPYKYNSPTLTSQTHSTNLPSTLQQFRLGSFTPSPQSSIQPRLGSKLHPKLDSLKIDFLDSKFQDELFSPSLLETTQARISEETTENHEMILKPEIPRLQWCAYCGKETSTKVIYENTSKTFWSSVAIFLMGGVLGCFMIPYMTNGCKRALFVCGRCEHPVS